jgi:hypothetical protein
MFDKTNETKGESMINRKDRDVVRELARQVAEIAALPVQEEKRALWRRLNALDPVRPMVMIDQVCWNEMAPADALALQCQDPDCRYYEERFRKTLFQWEHFRVDMVVDPFVRTPLAVQNSGFGVRCQEHTAVTDATSAVVGHLYENQFQTDADLNRIGQPTVSHDQVETARRLEVAHDLFDELLAVRPWGYDPYLSLWDPIATWMSVEDALYAMIDRPEFMHDMLRRMTDGYLSMLDQMEQEGLLCGPQSLIHCTGAWCDELPAEGYDPARPRTRDLWMFGLAQMLGSVSPAMFREFEVEYTARIAARFGLVYYGCCDPLDGKMNEVRMIPNVRKVSMSPWVDQRRGAEAIGRDFVFSRKPNPAHLAMEGFDVALIRADLNDTRDVCREYGCPLELILKDISTVRYQPQRLFDWANIAMEAAHA